MLASGVKYPLDIFTVCSAFSNLEIAVVPFTTPGLRGMAQPADASSPISCILLNSNLSYVEHNFQGIHELIHIYESEFCPGLTFRCYDRIKPNQDSYTEWVANEGAAELLMPYKIFIPYFVKLFYAYTNDLSEWVRTYGNKDIYDVIASQFNVTSIAVRNRVSALSYETDQFILGESVDSIIPLSFNKQKQLGVQTTDYIYLIQMATVKYDFGLPWDGVII